MKRSRFLSLFAGGGYPSSPGSKANQALSTLETTNWVTSRRWCPRPKPAIGTEITVSGGTHRLNGSGAFVSTAITVGAGFKFLETRVAASDVYDTVTTATNTVGSTPYAFTARTIVDPATIGFLHYTDHENYTETENYVD